jgi:serine/threonine protein kinase
MSVRCDNCGTTNGDEARFCAGCGFALVPPRDRDPLVGTTIAERFHVVRVIGEGGMGRVYYAEQAMGASKRPVAIKVLTTSPNDERAVARFHRECATVVALTHPNTIRFYDFGALPDQRLYIAMEYVDGRSLSSAIAEGPMAFAVVDRLVTQIGGALAEAHRRGIVHRDLKPDNVLLSSHGDEGEFAKVLDFGIAKNDRDASTSEITAAGTIVGTPAYMSPEQLSAKPVDERSDVYALGLMAYEMLTGTRPFNATTPLEWATAHLTMTPRSFDDFPSTKLLPTEKRAAILHALAKEPDDRTPTALRFVEDLTGAIRTSMPSTRTGDREKRPAVGDAPTVAGPTPTPRAVSRTSAADPLSVIQPRNRWLAYGALAALMTAVGAVGMVLVASGRTPTEPTDHAVDAAPAAIDAGSDAGPRVEWLRMLNGSNNADDATLALGPPDGRCSVLRPNGKIVVEITPDLSLATDGAEHADLEVVVVESRSGPYRLDVSMTRHATEGWTNIGLDVIGSSPFDVDEFGVHRFRYVRVKNTEASSLVCVDAIGLRLH